MLSRKDIRPKQTALLLANGFLPVSIDYRLCPEVNIVDGAMTDVCDALVWARETLPCLGDLGVRVNGDKVAVVGWSTGGTLSLQLGYTARDRGIKAPDATLAFYCPSNFEDECESDSLGPGVEEKQEEADTYPFSLDTTQLPREHQNHQSGRIRPARGCPTPARTLPPVP